MFRFFGRRWANHILGQRTMNTKSKLHPSQKVAASEVDVWTITYLFLGYVDFLRNTAALETTPTPIHLGQGFMKWKFFYC